MQGGVNRATDLEEEREVAAPARGDGAAQRGGVARDPVPQRHVRRERRRRGRMRAHPQLRARAVVGGGARPGVPGGEARDEGAGAAAAPLVVLHGAAQAQEPRHRRRGAGAVGRGAEEAEAHPSAAAPEAQPPLQRRRGRGGGRGGRHCAGGPEEGPRGGAARRFTVVMIAPGQEEERESEAVGFYGRRGTVDAEQAAGGGDGDGERTARGGEQSGAEGRMGGWVTAEERLSLVWWWSVGWARDVQGRWWDRAVLLFFLHERAPAGSVFALEFFSLYFFREILIIALLNLTSNSHAFQNLTPRLGILWIRGFLRILLGPGEVTKIPLIPVMFDSNLVVPESLPNPLPLSLVIALSADALRSTL
jgi:hypothetical protein